MYTIYVNGELVYNPAQQDTRPIITPKLSQEVNQAGDLQFVILPGHPLYDSLTPIDSYVTAYDDGEEVFYGRVLTPETPMLSGERQIHCEGALSFLLDAEMPPDPKQDIVEEDVDGNEHVVGTKFVHETMTAEEFFERCINTFNAQIDNDSRRIFHVGNVTHSKKNESREYQITSYQQIRSVIDTQLIEYYGGFIQARRGGDGLLYLDWLEGASRINPQPVAIGENVISQNNRISGENIFTHLRPIGKDGLTLPEDTLVVMPNTNYGKIIRSVTFGLAEDVSELRSQAQEYISKIEKMLLADADINLLDLHFIDGNVSKIRLGDGFTNLRGFEGELMTVATVERDFEQPQNDSITVKNAKGFESVRAPDGSDRNRVTSIGQVGTATSGGVSNSLSRSYGSSHSGLYKYIHESENKLEFNTEQIGIHARDLFETANNFLRLSHRQDSTQMRVGEIEGTAVIQNSARIAAVAGKFTIVRNDQTGIDDLYLQDGTELDISDQNGARISVGTAIRTTNGIVENHRQRIDTIQGSALWTQKDHIVAVSGEYDIETLSTGAKRLIIKSGGGLNIMKDNVQLGVYLTDDTGNTKLDGGLIVNKINNQTTTSILGDKILVGDVSSDDLETWASDAEGLIAARATISELNAVKARVDTLEADAITTNTLFAAIGQLTYVSARGIVSSGSIESGGSVYASNFYLGSSESGAVPVTNAFNRAQITLSGNTYTLQMGRFGQELETIGTFSRATTLGQTIGSNQIVVTASPQGNSVTFGIMGGNPGITWSGNVASVPGKVTINDGETAYDTGRRIQVDASQKIADAVAVAEAAAYIRGYNDNTTARVDKSSQTLGYGARLTITAQYYDYDGNLHNGTSCTITAPADRYITGYNANRTATLDNTSAITLDYGQSVTVYARQADYDGTYSNTGPSRTITAPSNNWQSGYNSGYNKGADDWTPDSITISDGKYYCYNAAGSQIAIISGAPDGSGVTIRCYDHYESRSAEGTSAGNIYLSRMTGDYGYVVFKISAGETYKTFYFTVRS